MTTTATGNFALTLENLEILIASSASFQAACGITEGDAATKQTAARERVYWPGQNLDAAKRPFAWIKLNEGWEATNEDTGGAGFVPKMPLQILFERDADKKDAPKERMVKFLNFLGAVIDEMQVLAKTDGYLYVTSFVVTGYYQSDPSEKECYDQAQVEVRVF